MIALRNDDPKAQNVVVVDSDIDSNECLNVLEIISTNESAWSLILITFHTSHIINEESALTPIRTTMARTFMNGKKLIRNIKV